MLGSLLNRFAERVNRRDLFRTATALAAPAFLPRGAAAAPSSVSPGLKVGPDIYQSIGLKPIINCRGTFTIIGGSLELPEVRAAQEAAAAHYVQLDEMMDAIGRRLAEITGAEFGMVSSGCAAALAHSTAACLAGGNPDLHVRIPHLEGFPKDEVVIPAHSRNVYDASVRSTGVRIVEASTPEQFEAALGPRVAMVYVLAGPNAENSPLNYDVIYRTAKQRNVPVLVDAAAEVLTIPNVHLQRGATLVAYSGGKCIRGPQCAGLLLGRKDLIRAAWVHSAPHHGYSRALKVGKEEAMGMLMAVEMWTRRDHQAEWKQWMSWLNHIGEESAKVQGVTFTVRETKELSNHTPTVSIRWDGAALGITGEEVANHLFTTEPRISLNGGGGGGRRGGGGGGTETGISIAAHMMQPGDDKIVAERIVATLRGATKKPPTPKQAPSTDISGGWNVHIEYASGSSEHHLFLRQTDGGRVQGTHQGDFVSRDLNGTIEGDNVKLASSIQERHGDSVSYHFTGAVQGDSMSGNLELGEYLGAKWTATRHQYRGRG